MIVFKTLRYQNLLSTGNQFTVLQLNRSKSTLVVGENGAGKSSFIEALTFALYGKPFRNINKPQLVNSITGKNLLVELEFSIGKKNYMVRRGIKPTIFEIWQNGSLINQNADVREYQDVLEKNILKLNFKSFSQIVVLGSANYIPFMQLAAQQRRGMVEDLLDIQIFSTMNVLLKEKVSTNKSDLQEVDYQINLCEQKIEMHKKHLKSIQQNNKALIDQKKLKIEEHESAIEKHRVLVNELMSSAEDLNTQIADMEKVSARKTKLIQMESALEDRVRKLNKDIKFFHDHDNCPTCKQGIDHNFKSTTVETRTVRLQEVNDALVKIDLEVAKSHKRLDEIAKVNQQIHKLNEEISSNNNQIKFFNRYIADLHKEIDALNKQVKTDANAEDTKGYKKEQDLNREKKEQLIHHKSLLDISQHLLKDSGIKTKIIRQYVPVMNKLINKYLASMDFFVNFELDDNFNETIKSRFRDEFSYASFSEGEKMRIDLALMFTWRTIAKLRNSASTNLLIMDEVFDSSLDATGTEEFLKILESLTTDTNTFIISHKGDALFDKFHSVIKFEKHANFSRIAV